MKVYVDANPISVAYVTEDGRTECQNCKALFDPVEIDVARRGAS